MYSNLDMDENLSHFFFLVCNISLASEWSLSSFMFGNCVPFQQQPEAAIYLVLLNFIHITFIYRLLNYVCQQRLFQIVFTIPI